MDLSEQNKLFKEKFLRDLESELNLNRSKGLNSVFTQLGYFEVSEVDNTPTTDSDVRRRDFIRDVLSQELKQYAEESGYEVEVNFRSSRRPIALSPNETYNAGYYELTITRKDTDKRRMVTQNA